MNFRVQMSRVRLQWSLYGQQKMSIPILKLGLFRNSKAAEENLPRQLKDAWKGHFVEVWNDGMDGYSLKDEENLSRQIFCLE